MKNFDEIFIDETRYGTKIPTSEYEQNGKNIIIDQGQGKIAGYTNQEKGLFENVPALIFGDHTRNIKYVDKPFFLGADGVKVLRSKYEDANYKYLYYALKNVKIPNTGYNRHFKWLKEAKIKYPEKNVQIEIVDILEKCEQIIETRTIELQKLNVIIEARFVELTEQTKTIPTRMGDIASYINGYAFKPTDWKEVGKPIIRIQNLNDVLAKYNYYDGELADKYKVSSGDVLISWATHLEAYIWEGGDAWLNQHIFKVLFDKMEVDKTYFVYATEEALRQAFKNAHGFKPTMEHIKRSDFENAIVKLPVLEVQRQFADFVTQVNKSKVAVQQALDKAQLLFDSLMQQYFG